MRHRDKIHRLNLTIVYVLVGALVTPLAGPVGVGMAQDPAPPARESGGAKGKPAPESGGAKVKPAPESGGAGVKRVQESGASGGVKRVQESGASAGMKPAPESEASAGVKPAWEDTSSAGATLQTITQEDTRYRLGPGDVIEIRVYNRPQLSLEATRVDDRGVIRVPLIEDDIYAACQTEIELAQEIAMHYRKYQKNPQVFVFVKEYNSQPVAVIGAVERPGRFQLQRRIRLLELISLVGGPTEKAGTRLQVAHMGGGPACDSAGRLTTNKEGGKEGQSELVDFEIYSLPETMQGDFKANPYIQPGDVVTIPEAEEAFVVGNVYKPSPVLFKTDLTVSQAIAMAGGVLPDSDINKVRILRQQPGSRSKTELVVNLQAINRRQAEDTPLQPGDIVEVGGRTGKRILRNILGSAIPSLANLPLYVIR